jgi:glycine cleavage system H protein
VRATNVDHEFNVPSGIFFTRSHTWIDIQPNGMLLIGLDDFAEKLLGTIDGVELPSPQTTVEAGEPLFTILHENDRLEFPAPASGTVSLVNGRLPARPDLINSSPFEEGWVCGIDPSNLPSDLQEFRIGADAVAWYEEEIERYSRTLEEISDEDGEENPAWKAFSRTIREINGTPNGVPSLEGQERT